jgi:glycine cleavage system H lipoate-binding protein
MNESVHQAQAELPCIWVLAGVLSYRLCDRNYECEECELFRVLRGSGHDASAVSRSLALESADGSPSEDASIEGLVSSYVCRLTTGCELHLDRPYCPSHFWLRRSHGRRVDVGLDGHLLRVLYPLDDITLPHVGVLLRHGEPCGWIRRGRKAIPLSGPLRGQVVEVNDAYVEALRASGGVDGGEDWLFSIETDQDLDRVPGLYRGEKTLLWYLKKVQLIKRYLREAAATGVDGLVGVTMADGGEPNLNVEQVLGRERFEALVDEMFALQI